jgi:hypothetical protein
MKKTLTLLALLAMSAAPAVAQNHGAGPVEIPLRVVAGRLIVAVQAPDGTAFDFILSTGTPPTVLTAATAAALGDTPALTLGGLPVSFEGSQTISDDSLEIDGHAFAGMVGPSTFNAYDMLVDVPGARMVLRPLGRPAPWAGVTLGDPVSVRVFHGQLIAMQADLNGESFFANLDLGRNKIIVNSALATKLNLADVDTATVSLGGHAVADVSIEKIDMDVMARWDPDNNGFMIIGAPAVLDCAIAISWVRSEIQMCAR